jgi:hypothetical protein
MSHTGYRVVLFVAQRYKKGKPSNRRISEVYHHQPSTLLVQKTTNTLSFLYGLKCAVQNLTKRNLWGEEIVECSVQIFTK